jgi:rhamnulokinase
MMPDLLAYFLTGQGRCERTEASTSQLYDPRKQRWNEEVIRRLDLPLAIMPELADPGTVIGEIDEGIKRQAGLKRAVVLAPCTHDTASAVAAVPAHGLEWAFLSSGTWSMLGAITKEVVTSHEAFSAGLINQMTLGGFYLCYGFMGLWLLQQMRKVWERQAEAYSYDDLVRLAEQISEARALIDPSDRRFLAPPEMGQALRQYCLETGQCPPQGAGEITRCILESLALTYRRKLDQLARTLNCRFRVLHIVGGGSKNSLLCQLTANATGLQVVAGPSEATVAGNVLVQALARGCISSPTEIREVVRGSTALVEYEPRDTRRYEERYGEYVHLLEKARGD